MKGRRLTYFVESGEVCYRGERRRNRILVLTSCPNSIRKSREMSLVIVLKGREGIAMAADSRITFGTSPPVYYDNATKLLRIDGLSQMGVLTYGASFIDEYSKRTVHSFLPEMESLLEEAPSCRPTVKESSSWLSQFLMQKYGEATTPSSSSIEFLIGGFDKDDPYGKVFRLSIPTAPEPIEMLAGPHPFGILWGGMPQIAQRIILGFDSQTLMATQQILNLGNEQSTLLANKLAAFTQTNIPYEVLDLQDCVDFVILLIRTTITILNLTTGNRGVGGPIDVATITRADGFNFVQKKSITGEGARHAI